MTKKIDSILKDVLERIEPSKKDLDFIEKALEIFLKKIEGRIKSLKLNAEVFVGGSFAKGTMIKKDDYDIDIFIRFSKEHGQFSKLTERILKGMNPVKVHGSRDYFRVKARKDVFFEVVPVLKVKNPKEAENITDLSYSHVKYINKEIKGKVLDDIKLAKVFCYANNCYGAESYIGGFSGYALELLVYYYGSFLKFVKVISKIKEKEVVDIEKHYRNKQRVLLDINSSKLQSPIILVDPTYKQRNALAALSSETFEKFKKVCAKFLRNPSARAFEVKKTDLDKIKRNAKENKNEFLLLEVRTNRQAGDIAGSKLLKFYKHLEEETRKFFVVKNKGFNYNGQKSARFFFVAKPKKEILIEGPKMTDVANVKKFSKKHKNVFHKNHRAYAREKVDFNLKKFLSKWKVKNKKKIKEMGVVGLEIISQ